MVKREMTSKKTILLCFCLIVVFSSNLCAALKIESAISDNVLMAGDVASIQIKINGARSGVNIKPPVIDGLIIRQLGQPTSSSQTTIINGKMTQFSGLVYKFNVQTTKIGKFTIPPIQISHKGSQYQTKSFSLNVIDAGKTPKMIMEVVASKTEIFPTEPVLITLNWYIQDNIAEYELRFPLLNKKDQINLKLSEKIQQNKTTTLNIDRYEVPFQKSTKTKEGLEYTVYTTEFVIFPDNIGKMILSPASIKAFIRVGTEIKTNFFGERVRVPKHKKIFAASKPVTINIKELPQKEKTPYFTGAIGEFNIALSSNASRVKVGDPIEIQIKVTGTGKLDKIEAPILTEMDGYQNDFVIVNNLQPGDILENAIIFKQVIRPKHDKITKIPAVHFSYFNTNSSEYKTITSNTVPLKVLPSKQVQKSDIINFNQPGQSIEKNRAFSGQGIQANYIFEDALQNQQEQILWLYLLILPPFIYFGLLWFTRQQRMMSQDQALLRSKSAKGLKNKRLKQAKQLMENNPENFLQALSISISGFISDRLNLGNAELTTTEIQALVDTHKLDKVLFNEVTTLLEEMDRYRFMGRELSDTDRSELFNNASNVLNRMHKIL